LGCARDAEEGVFYGKSSGSIGGAAHRHELSVGR
jgi:hypothetical protein